MLYNVVLVSALQQSESVIHIHTKTYFKPSSQLKEFSRVDNKYTFLGIMYKGRCISDIPV